MKTVRMTIDPMNPASQTAGRIDEARVDATTEQDIARHKTSLSGILCLRHSMSKRSIYAKESKGRCGGHGGIAAHFV